MRSLVASGAVLCALLTACGTERPAQPTPPEVTTEEVTERAPDPPVPPTMHQPVPFFEEGRIARTVDAAADRSVLVLDLGDEWTPYLFTESDGPGQPTFPHPYRPTYLALARGEYPDDYHGERAREDKYLELYGIPPTLTVLRERMEHVSDLTCVAGLDLGPLAEFDGYIGYEDSRRAQTQARRTAQAEHFVERQLAAQEGRDLASLSLEGLSRAEIELVNEWRRNGQRFRVIDAIQKRLQCEGYFAGKGRFVRGALDWATHEAIAEFERRHRLLGWGNVSRETTAALRRSPMELEREAVIRVLTERAMHDAGIIEDGSVSRGSDGRPNTYPSADGTEVPIPNLEAAVRDRIVEAFGLSTPESTLAFLRSLETIGARRTVGIRDVERPAYHGPDMDLHVEIDRGDVWYDFPYDEEGRERGQGVQRRPMLTLFVRYRGREIPLVRYGTTIGGWRTEFVDGNVMWAYKGSPPGSVLWERIVSAPIWMPPESSPPRSLLVRTRNGWAPNQHEVGPSYASAYGLVAAYHRPYVRDESGNIQLRGDQGIRTHGSVDYMSIARRHSHGCHRLHNHLAVRMMSYVLRHRPHQRRGEADVAYGRRIEFEGKTYSLSVTQGGYEFALARPVPVEVLPGRILGERTSPIDAVLPRYDSTVGAYVLPDGGAAIVDRHGNVTSIPWPGDAGVPHSDAGIGADAARPSDGGAHPHAEAGGAPAR